MTDQEFYSIYAVYDRTIQRLESKLFDYKLKNIHANIDEQQEVIDNLISLRQAFHKLRHTNLMLSRGQMDVVIEREKLLNTITRLQKENENLKNNLNL